MTLHLALAIPGLDTTTSYCSVFVTGLQIDDKEGVLHDRRRELFLITLRSENL